MKKLDAKGKQVSIKVKNKEDIRHIIGSGGKSIKRVANLLNASSIRVS